MTPRQKLLSVARGESPADLVVKNARLVDVFTGQIETDSAVAIADGVIAGVGAGYRGRDEIDLRGAYLAPGLIDAHVHIESSLCVPVHFASAIVPRGVTTVVADPHEIANVCGEAGVRFIAESSRGLALRVVLMAPSCVPATDMATSGARLGASDLASMLRAKLVHGLAEVMNFPGVVRDDPDMRAKIEAFDGRLRDGHAPGLTGQALNAYIAAGIGNDHECVNLAEAREKLSRGMYVLIREATNARNLEALLPLLSLANNRRICFCTDDRTPPDLLDHGSVDMMVRRAIAAGVDPISAIRCATLNPSECFGLHDRGAIAPGRIADLFVFDELSAPVAKQVFIAGHKPRDTSDVVPHLPGQVGDSFRAKLDALSFAIPARTNRMRVIGSLPDQLLTDHRIVDVNARDGFAVADVASDVLKMAVVERHRATGNIGLGFIQGIGLKQGAIAGTVAHDHHNLVIIGCDDPSMHTAARAVADLRGGLVVAVADRVIASLALPVAGLMSDRPIDEVRTAYLRLLAAARDLGSPLHDPFMAMSFMSLEVIPKLKLTDQGLVDVEKFVKVDLFV